MPVTEIRTDVEITLLKLLNGEILVGMMGESAEANARFPVSTCLWQPVAVAFFIEKEEGSEAVHERFNLRPLLGVDGLRHQQADFCVKVPISSIAYWLSGAEVDRNISAAYRRAISPIQIAKAMPTIPVIARN